MEAPDPVMGFPVHMCAEPINDATVQRAKALIAQQQATVHPEDSELHIASLYIQLRDSHVKIQEALLESNLRLDVMLGNRPCHPTIAQSVPDRATLITQELRHEHPDWDADRLIAHLAEELVRARHPPRKRIRDPHRNPPTSRQ